MSSLAKLPVEVLLHIFEVLVTSDGSMPTVGDDAIWANPDPPNIPALPRQRVMLLEEDEFTETSNEYVNHSALKSLRLTNKYLNDLCTPLLYREFDRLSSWPASWSENLQKYVLEPYWQLITVLRLCVDHSAMSTPGRHISVAHRLKQKYDSSSVAVLSACKNIRSLGLYYARQDADFTPLSELVVDFLENGRLCTVGIYSKHVINAAARRIVKRGTGPSTLLQAITTSQRASDTLKVLDIVAEDYTLDLRSCVQDAFQNLKSISLRQVTLSNERGLPIYQDPEAITLSKQHLTKIRLVECYNLDIELLSNLLRQLDSIQDLTVIKCSTTTDANSRTYKHFKFLESPDSACNSRQPLRSLHIEGMQESAIVSLGVIPTLRLTLIYDEILEIFLLDSGLFPSLKTLQVLPGKHNIEGALPTPPLSDSHDINDSINMISLESFCQNRKITLKKDAESFSALIGRLPMF